MQIVVAIAGLWAVAVVLVRLWLAKTRAPLPQLIFAAPSDANFGIGPLATYDSSAAS